MRKLLLVSLTLLSLPAAQARAQEMVTICHSTGSERNPYTTLTLTNDAVLEHVNHEDDLIPAPAGGCPTTVSIVEEPTPTPTPTTTATPGYVVPTPTATPAPTAIPLPDDDDRDRDDDDAAARGGDSDGGGTPTRSAQPSVSEAQAADMRHLPLTGAEMWLVAGAGLGFLLCGLGVRLRLPA